jgi:DNA-binding MarR family transcriptional regulator
MTKNKPEPSPLTAHLGFWMRMVSNQVSGSFARKLEAAGVTVTEWVVLRTLFGDGAAPSAVAEAVGLSRGQVSKLVDALTRRGLVLREESASDRRYQRLRLSARGEAVVPRLAALADANDADHFACLNPGERRKLFELLKKAAAALPSQRIPIQ